MYLLLFEDRDENQWYEEYQTVYDAVTRIRDLQGNEPDNFLQLVTATDLPIGELLGFYQQQIDKLAGTVEARVTKLLGAPPATLPLADVQPDLQRVEWAIKELDAAMDVLTQNGANDQVRCDIGAQLHEVQAELSRLLP